MKKALSLLLALVMIVTCLTGISFAADPLFEVTNGVEGAEAKQYTTIADMTSNIKDDGTTVVKFLADVTATTAISISSACTIDMDGHKLEVKDGSGEYASNGFNITAATNTAVTTVKNGTIVCKFVGVRVNKGSVLVENMVLRSTGGANVGIYTASAESTNIIRESILLSDIYLNLGFYSVDHSGKTKVVVENSDLVAFKPAGSVSIDRNGTNAKTGIVEFGGNVRIYSAKADYKANNPTITGKEVLKAEGTAAYQYGDINATGLNMWYTEPFATVQTGDTVVNVTNLTDMVAAIDKKGGSVVTLYEDITADAVTNLPICTLDLNGHTWKTTAGNAIAIVDTNLTDNDNCYTVIKNGTIYGAMSAIRHETGGLKISNCTLRSDGSAAIQILDEVSKGNYNDGNIIENSVLDCTIWAVLAYNRGKDFSALSYKIVNSDLIASKPAGSEVFGRNGSATSGTYELGENVNLYTYKSGDTAYKNSACPVTGSALTKLSGTYSVEAMGTTYEGLFRWTTEAAQEVVTLAAENGTFTVSPTSARSGETVTVITNAAAGYKFSKVLVNGVEIDGKEFVMPKGGASVSVEFVVDTEYVPAPEVRKPTYHGITIETVEGGTVTVSNESATINTVIKMEVAPAAGYVLESISVKKLYNGTYAKVAEDNSFYMPYSNVVITPVFKKA